MLNRTARRRARPPLTSRSGGRDLVGRAPTSGPDRAACTTDESLPGCGTGPFGRLRWVCRELVDIVRPRGGSGRAVPGVGHPDGPDDVA